MIKTFVVVKFIPVKKLMISYKKKPWLIHVPAAAVIHEWQALFVMTERREHLDVKFKYIITLLVRNIILYLILKNMVEVKSNFNVVIKYKYVKATSLLEMFNYTIFKLMCESIGNQ